MQDILIYFRSYKFIRNIFYINLNQIIKIFNILIVTTLLIYHSIYKVCGIFS